MKKYFLIIIGFIFLASCQNNGTTTDDLAGKKALLKEKKAALKTLENEINTLENEILILDPPKEKPAVLVNATQVNLDTFLRFVDLQGSVTADDLVNVSAEVGGRIIKTYVDEGSRVRKGQLIAKLDLDVIQKQINELETSLSLATTVFERQQRLWEQEIGSEIQFLEAKNNKDRLEKSLETLSSQLSKQNLFAPITGVVDSEFLKEGEMASPGMPIMQILNTNKVTIVADVPEQYLGKLKSGDMVSISFPALNMEIKRRITSLGRTIDPANRTFKIEIETANPDGVLKPNLLAEVKFLELEVQDVIVAQIDYIMEEVSGQKYAFIESKKDGKSIAQKVYITLGEAYNGNIIIKNGLNSGDVMITDGARNIAANDPIIISISKTEISNG